MRPLALITGGKRGIGRGIALALAQGGHDLVLLDRDAEAGSLDDLTATGVRVHYRAFDLAAVAGHGDLLGALSAEFGTFQILVNNAGIGSVERGPFAQLRPELFDTVLATNLRGTVFFTQAALPHLRSPGGVIVTITSVSAATTSPERLDYCISKAGLSAFSSGLAVALAESGVAVFEVRPGIIETQMVAGVKAAYDQRIADGLVPMKRWGQPGDIGGIVAALASGSFAFATGSIINADGGLSIARL